MPPPPIDTPRVSTFSAVQFAVTAPRNDSCDVTPYVARAPKRARPYLSYPMEFAVLIPPPAGAIKLLR
jgi:hypothetical protein